MRDDCRFVNLIYDSDRKFLISVSIGGLILGWKIGVSIGGLTLGWKIGVSIEGIMSD